jgi:DNA-binding GntR family transcriptional regulator
MTQEVYSRIKRKIITLELQPGEVISEKKLEQELGIGRTPIREALLTLKVEKFIEGSPNKPFYVKEISLKSVRDLFEALVPIEKMTTVLAAQRMGEEDFQALARANESIDRAIQQRDYWELTNQNREFHRLITRGSDNEYLLSIHENLRNQAERLSFLAISSESQGDSANAHNEKIRKHHHRLLSLLFERNTQGLEKLAEEHIKLFQARVLQYLRIL